MNTIKVKLNIEIDGFGVGRVVPVEVDENKVAVDRKWRRILKDSLIDNCVEIVEDKPQVKRTEKREEKKEKSNK